MNNKANKKFEDDVIGAAQDTYPTPSTLESSPLNPQLSVNSKEIKATEVIKKNKSKFFIIIFAFITVSVGLIILLRGVFINNSPSFNNSDLGKNLNKIFNQNQPSEINGIKENLTTPPQAIFGNNIKNSFTSDYSDQKIWIAQIEKDQVKVGYIDDFQNFNLQYTLPQNSTQISLYEDGSLSYIVNSQNGLESKLYTQEINTLPSEVLTLNAGEDFINTFFQSTEKVFYFTSFDTKTNLNVKGVSLNGKTFDIFTSNYLNNKTKIIFVDNIKNAIYLQNNISCYVLTLLDKNLQNYNCQNIKRNNEDKVYWSNSNTTGVYNSTFAGEIYQTASNDISRKVILTGGVGEIFNNITYHNNFIYFVTYQLRQISTNVWSAQQQSIDKLDLVTFQRTHLTSNLPILSLVKIIPQANNFYGIVGQNQILQRYNPNPTIISYPVSYITPSGQVVTDSLYWSNFGLDPLAFIEILGTKYTIN